MKYIDKKTTKIPASFQKHLLQPNHHYDNYPEKDDLRTSLLGEQGYICCYCMRRIAEPTGQKMVIEHFKPQSLYPDLQFDYNNLLASCHGGGNKNAPEMYQHCDERKKSHEIAINPLNQTMMEHIKFTANGEIYTENEFLDSDINNVLNLNLQQLKNERKAIILGLEQKIKQKFKGKTVSKSFINELLKEWSVQKENQYRPMCQVAIHYLQKKMKQAV
jgi:uncharacterized protein (TIGR02646 family)